MSLDAYVYDDRLIPLSYTHLDLTETDDKGCTVDQLSTAPLRPSGFGAKLSLPIPAKAVALFVDDIHPSPSYAPASIQYVNGSLPTRLDVILYPLPKVPPSGGPTSGAGPSVVNRRNDQDRPFTMGNTQDSTEDALRALSRLLDNPEWSAEEKKGAMSLLVAVQLAYSYVDPGYVLMSKRLRWASLLRSIGIAFIAIARNTREDKNEGESGVMGAS